MRTAFGDLVHRLDRDALLFQIAGGAAGRDDGEAQPCQLLYRRQDNRLVAVLDGYEGGATLGENGAGADLRFGEGGRKIAVDAHDFAGAFHFGREDRIDAGETGEGENRFLDCNVRNLVAVNFRQVLQLLARHDARGDLRDG